MASQTLTAKITEQGHPLQGCDVHIRWSDDPGYPREYVAVEVKLPDVPPSRSWSRWVPIQLADSYIAAPTGKDAA